MSTSSAKNNDLFKGVNPELLEQITISEPVEFREGDIIFQTGEPSENMYLVLKGEVKLKLQGGLSSPVVVRKHPNQYFGEIEITGNTERRSSSVAETDCSLISLSKKDVMKLMEVSGQFKDNLSGGTKTPEGIRRRDILFSNKSEKISDIPFLKNDKINFNDPEDVLPGSTVEEETPPESEPYPAVNNEILLPPGMEQSPQTSSEEIAPDNFDYSQSFNQPDNSFSADQFFTPAPEADTSSFDEITDDNFQTPFLPEPKIPISELPDENLNKFSFPPDDANVQDDFTVPGKFETPADTFPPPDNFVSNFDSDFTEIPVRPEQFEPVFPNEEEITPPPYQEQFNIPEREISAPRESSTEEIYLDILVAVQKIGSTIAYEQLFSNVAEAVTDLIKCSSAELYITDAGHNKLLNSEGENFDTENSVPGICYSSKEITYGENRLLVPVENKAGLITGVLQLNNSNKGTFDKKDEQIIKAVVPFIANIIENSRLLSADTTKYKIESLAIASRLIAGDIKRPLLMIRHYVEFLKHKEAAPDELKILELISEQSGSILELTQTIKEFSQGTLKPNLVESEITLVMDEFLALLAEYTDSRKIKVLRKYEGQGTALIDKRKLYQAVYQIVKNACDSMPGEGKVYFTVKREDPNLIIEIKDEGTGIPQDIYMDILNPFVSSKKDAAGLGLTIAKEIITGHKGELQYSSASGEGSVFRIILPAADIF